MYKIIFIVFVCFFIYCSKSTNLQNLSYSLDYQKEGDILSLNDDLYFKFINALDSDEDQNLYISDANRRVIKCRSDGKIFWIKDKMGEAPGEFQRVTDVCYSAGKVFICDQKKISILIFQKDGKYLNEFKLKEGMPIDIEIDSKGIIYIQMIGAISHNNLIYKYSSEGIYLGSIIEKFYTDDDKFLERAKNGFFFCLDQKDNIVLGLRYEYKIFSYSPEGKMISKWTRELPYKPEKLSILKTQNQMRIVGSIILQDIEIDENGYVYTLWGGQSNDYGLQVDIFSPDGKLIKEFRNQIKPPHDWQRIHSGVNNKFYVINMIEDPNIYIFTLKLKSQP